MSRGVSDKITFKPYSQNERWLLPPSLDELVPQNHFVRTVSKIVDELNIGRCLQNTERLRSDPLQSGRLLETRNLTSEQAINSTEKNSKIQKTQWERFPLQQ